MNDKQSKTAIGYCRVSTKEQGDKFGIDAQKQAIEEYANQNGYKIVDWVFDNVSGVIEDRDGWNRIIVDPKVQKPPYDAVIVFKSDRVARDLKLYFYFEWLLLKKGVELVSVNDGFPDVPNEYKGIIKSFILFSAEQERHNITLRTSGGRTIKAKTGGYAGGKAPFGYKVVEGELIIDVYEAEVVKLIFNLRNQGKSYNTISKELNKRELFTRSGGLWGQHQVWLIIQNEKTYRGFYHYGKAKEWVKGKQEAILK